MKLLFLTIFTMVSSLSFAQSSDFSCTYATKMSIPESVKAIEDPAIRSAVMQQLSTSSQQYQLLVSKDAALFKPLEANSGTTMSIGGIGHIYVDRKEKTSKSIENILDRKFLITETLKSYDWVISDETKNINGKSCKLASLKNDSKIRAWFTVDIPIQFGPMGYYGLPGLIVQLETPTKEYSLVEIKPLVDKSQLQEPTDGKKISREDFESLKAKKEKELGISKENKGGVQIITM